MERQAEAAHPLLPDRQVPSPRSFRTYLGISHLHIKMGVVMMVTSRVTTAPHIEFIIIPFLSIITGHVSLALLADNIADKTSFTLEVITDSIGFVGGVPVFEDRSSLGCSYRIDHATGKTVLLSISIEMTSASRSAPG